MSGNVKPKADLSICLLAGVIAAESETQTVTVPADPAIPGSAQATVSQVSLHPLHYPCIWSCTLALPNSPLKQAQDADLCISQGIIPKALHPGDRCANMLT